MSGGGGNTVTTQKSDPWVGQAPYLSGIFSQANNAYNQYAGNPSSSVAGFTPMQNQAMGITQNVANGTNFGNASGVNNSAGNYTTNLLNGNFLNSNPGNSAFSQFANGSMMNNPYMSQALGAANDAITRSYQTATAPQTTSAFEGSGRYGSGAYNQAVSQNQQDLATQLGNVDSSMLNNMYQQNMGNMLQGAAGLSSNYNTAAQQQLGGLSMSPNIVNSINGAATNLYNMGGNQQALQQSQINAPWQLLNNYSGIINSLPSGLGSQTSTQPYYTNSLAGGMGGALSGAALGSAIMPGLGTGIGAGLGGLMGLFSDRRLKTGIERTGERLENGLPVYRYRYVWDAPDMERIGVMADDVRCLAPWAVWRDPSGFDKVDYAAIGAEHLVK
ncbi:tail fiber domain-containing protein [Burkholderia cenocepacia]|uniref:tail fiber domain-containing protein n=1 Tax=Burkholderia cenocepacia TaxID=95486 RepID=UPI002B245C26|nr:tail fiber domain-containing protein [Burkholderia cenocepacia]MEB2554044.1 tail fiber domain-containing protein [Burkholderia cenocepacia]